ncbi:hypothetical protein AAFF_G00261220 [Aldrovandia affinis]|uniref:Uncharacterized protein n=1 Tax=Aldrovandia affinis TaxID=143900 RepID=A0AAD7RBS0_9TELE|nr:hypothetical protein AAFF_G00261220 [Aldrovandia affinis]
MTDASQVTHCGVRSCSTIQIIEFHSPQDGLASSKTDPHLAITSTSVASPRSARASRSEERAIRAALRRSRQQQQGQCSHAPVRDPVDTEPIAFSSPAPACTAVVAPRDDRSRSHIRRHRNGQKLNRSRKHSAHTAARARRW